MRRIAVLLIIPAMLFAQAPPSARAPDDKPKRPPTPREYAQQLLDGVHDTAGSAGPLLSPFLLWRAADAYIAIDKKIASSRLEEAFDRASAMPPDAIFDPRTNLQVWIATSMSELDLAGAAEMLGRIHVVDREMASDPRSYAVSRVIAAYVKDKKIDAAIEFVNSLGANGPYPYAAVRQIIEALGEDDGRRVALFGNAIAAYQSHPNEEFGKLVGAHWKDLPRAQVEAALDGIVQHVSSYTDEQNNFHVSYTTAKGIATLPRRNEYELFYVIAAMRAYQPEKLEKLLASDKDLAQALEILPDGFDRSQIQGTSMGMTPKAGGPAPDQSNFLVSSTITARAMKAVKDSPEQAFEIAKSIPDPAWRAGCYQQLAVRLLGGTPPGDPARSRQALLLAIDSLEKTDKQFNLATQIWASVIDLAFSRLKDEDLAKEAFSKSLDALEPIYLVDSNPDNPNLAPIDDWPSTAAYRRAFMMAAKLYGISGSSYFEKLHDPNELLEAQVAFAAELLHRPAQPGMTASSHAKKQ